SRARGSVDGRSGPKTFGYLVEEGGGRRVLLPGGELSEALGSVRRGAGEGGRGAVDARTEEAAVGAAGDESERLDHACGRGHDEGRTGDGEIRLRAELEERRFDALARGRDGVARVLRVGRKGVGETHRCRATASAASAHED